MWWDGSNYKSNYLKLFQNLKFCVWNNTLIFSYWFSNGTSIVLCYLLNNTKLEVLLVIIDRRVGVLVLIAIVEHWLAGDTLLPPGDGCHLPHRPGGPVSDIPSLNWFRISFPTRGPLHLSISVGMNSTNILLIINSSTECISNIVIVIFFPLALHEQAGTFHKLVHRHFGCYGKQKKIWS